MKRIIRRTSGKLMSIAGGIIVASSSLSAKADCVQPPSGIVSWWPGEGDASDIISTNNGMLEGIATFGPGEVGQAFSFNGTNGYVLVPASGNLNVGLGTGFTVEGWIDPANVSTQQIIMGWHDSSAAGNLGVHMQTGTGSGGSVNAGSLYANIVDTSGGYHIIYSASVLESKRFEHVALTYDKSSGVAVLYGNGSVVALSHLGVFMPQTSYDLYVGARPGWPLNFSGNIDELSIYSRALSSNEIAAIYQAGSAGKCVSTTTSTGVPQIWSFYPNSGANNTVVRIQGTNFSATATDDIVYFGAVRANVLSATPATLFVVTPPGATYAPITVTVNGRTAWANQAFLPTFANGTTYSIALASRLDLPAGNGPGQTVFADVDGDGKPDLLVNSGAGFMSIYRNISTNGALIGAASFAPRVDVPISGKIQNAALVDLDGDGKLDIAVLDRDLDQVHVLKNVASVGNITTNSFVLMANLATGNDPRGIVVRDLDGDGLPDIAVANWADSTVAIYHNVGTTNGITTNSFAAPLIYTVGAQPQDLKAADLDGDGKPDLVTANNNYGTTNSVSILQNTSSPGAISFASQIGLTGMPTSYWMAIGDLDGDGKPDLVVSSFDQGQAVSIYRNLSTSGVLTSDSFAPHVDFGLPGWGNAVAIGDLDGDGKPDLAAVTQLSDGLSIFLNRSTPGSLTANSLAPRLDYPTGWNPNGLAIGDIDGDGRPDIAFAVDYAATVSIYQNVSAPAVNPPTTNPPAIFNVSPAIATVGSTISISGTNFSPVASSNIVYFGAVRANVSAATATMLTVTVPAGATFGPITVAANGLTAYSGQYFEPTFSGSSSNITTSSFAPSFNLNPTNGPADSVIADLDGDGKPDIAMPCSGGHVIAIFRNISTNGTPLSAASFAPEVDLPFPTEGTSGTPYRLRAVDLDGDGKLDLIACEVSGNRVTVFHNVSVPGTLSTASFEPAFALIAGGDCRSATASDLDGDGRVDIVALNYGDKTISLFKNIGSNGVFNANSFAPPVVISAPGGPYEAVIADLDGDGRPDLAVAESDGGTVSIYQNAGGSLSADTFPSAFELPTGNTTAAITAADLDGDGKLDLIAGSVQSEIISVFRNISTGGTLSTNSFAPRVDFGTGDWTHTISIADFNGDGKPDIAVVGELPSTLSVFQNISTPGDFTSASLAPRVDFGTGWNAWGVATGDLDGDGRPDIVFCNYYDSTVQIYQNVAPFGSGAIAPIITSQPTNVVVPLHDTAIFNVTATGTEPLAYQWRFNGTNVDGGTSATLVITNATTADTGSYSVVVTNLFGAAISSNALLYVLVPPTPPTIISQTPSQVMLLGNPVTFAVAVDGSEPLSFFWSRNGTLIPNATNSFYTLADAQLADSGSEFSCLITNVYGTATTTNAMLKVLDTVSNDLCSGAVVITNYAYTNFQSTLNASSYGDPVPDCIDGFGNGVWYRFTAPANGLLTVDTFGSDFDTGLAAYSGSCDSLTEVACDDDTMGVTSQVSLPTTAGNTYYFLAGGYGGHAGNLIFHLNYVSAPIFDVQPTNLSVAISNDAIFSPVVSGSQPIAFQWYFNDTPLVDGSRFSGATNSTLTISDVQPNDGGNYQLVASNFVGVTTSSVAVLTPVLLPPTVVEPPVNAFIGLGSNANFSAVIGGTPPFSYQWSFNGAPLVDDGVHIAGATTSSLSISNITTADDGAYYLTVTNAAGTAVTSGALTVLVPPVITTQPVGRSVPPGLPTAFTAVVSGTPAPNYQWRLNGTNIPGATGLNYTNNAVTTNTLGFYQLVASNLMGVVVSSNAELTFGPVAAWGRNTSNECLPPPGLTNVVELTGVLGGSYAVHPDGTVTTWGNPAAKLPITTNIAALFTDGLGAFAAIRPDGTMAMSGGVYLPPLTNIVSVALGSVGGVALRAEGSIIAWGNGQYMLFPQTLSHVTSVAVGNQHALALRSDGSVVAWGTGPAANVPAGLGRVTAIAAGSMYSLALKANGTVVAWGSYGSGTNLPPGLTNIVAISANNSLQFPNLALALRANGTVVAWGDNPGYGTTNPPAALSNLLSVAIAATPYHSLDLVSDGAPQILHPPIGLTTYTGRDVTLGATVVGAMPLTYQWLYGGQSIRGATNSTLIISNIQTTAAGSYQLLVSNSIATTVSQPALVNVIKDSNLKFLSQTSVSATNVYQADTVTFYGGTVLGSGPLRYQWFSSPTNRNYTAVSGATNDVFSLDPALAVQSGYYYLAISNQYGGVTSAPVNVKIQFARAWGFQAVSNPPVNVTNAIAIATGSYSTYYGDYFALGADGKLTSWANYYSQFGETNVSALSNSFVTAIAAGSQTSLALKSDGTVYAWGNNQYGQTNVPPGLNNVVAVACGGYHDLALKADGTVAGWGALNGFNYGQAATNPNATNVVAIAAGNYHSLALRADGTVAAWGSTLDGSTVVPAIATNVVAIAAGSGFSAALRANGTVVQWGAGLANYPPPKDLSNVVAISASLTHCTALRNDGTVVSWGYGPNGAASNGVPPDLTNVVAIASGGVHDFGLLGTRAPAFTVQPWNRLLTYDDGKRVISLTLAGKCAGVQPVRYQWLLNGTNYPGATNDTLTLRNDPQISSIVPGAYQLVASNAYGVTVSKPAKVSFFVPLSVALDTTNILWSTSGSASWYGETNVTHDGVDAARSGGIGPNQESILQTVLATNNPGNIRFWWKVSSELFFDTLEFRLNGISLTNISGEVDWQQVTIPLATGTNVLEWRYSKDATFDAGLDAGFVDQFSFTAAPVIVRQPQGVTVNSGGTISLLVAATGSPSLGYQWLQNGAPIGGNSSALTLPNATRALSGIYSVTVTNGGGATVSQDAVVRVNAPQLLGTPTILPDGTIQLTSSDMGGGTLSDSDLASFEAQASTDLVNWVTLPNALSITNGVLVLHDTTGTNYATRFYRIIEH